MPDYVTTKDFMQETKELRKEAKEDRHEFSNLIQSMLLTFDEKLDKIITNNVKIDLMEKDLEIIKEDHKEIKKTVEGISRKQVFAMWFIWAISWAGTFMAQIIFK